MKQLFRNMGCSIKETEVFITLLQLGAQPVSVIAKQMHMPRSSMYAVLERLKKLQLIVQWERQGITYVKCIPVKEIADILKLREKTIEQTFAIFEETLPELEKLENKLSITPTVRFYEGKKAVMKIYEEVIRANEFVAFFNPAAVNTMMPEYYFKLGDMLKKNGGHAKELLVPGPQAVRYKKRFDSQRHQIKFLPKHALFYSDTLICRDTIYMISYGEKEVSGTGIQNPTLAQSQRAIFEELWSRI